MKLTKEITTTIATQINDALIAIAKKNDLNSLHCKASRFEDGHCTFKVMGVAKGALNPEAQRYDDAMDELGLPQLESEFSTGGVTYMIVGLNAAKKKVLCVTNEDKRAAFNVDIVVALAPAPTAKKKAA